MRRSAVVLASFAAIAATACATGAVSDAGDAPDAPDAGAAAAPARSGGRSDAGASSTSPTSPASPSADAGAAADAEAGVLADGAPDAPTGPTAQECLEGWRNYAGACPAPVITSSYVANGCVGTTGWFVEGQNFQVEQHNTGIADYGPQSFGANGNQKIWNVITPTLLCVTVYAGYKDTWVGKTIYVVNPDGKSSNSVVVQDKI